MTKAVRRAVARTLQTAPLIHKPDVSATHYNVDVSFVDDLEIRALNRDYRGKDKPTDVLSFALLESAAEDEFELPATPEANVLLLGDVVIAVETALRQARERRHDAATETAFLGVHGTLHLMGYDHDTNPARRRMWKWQEEIIQFWILD